MKLTEAYTVYNNGINSIEPQLSEAIHEIIEDSKQRIEQAEEVLNAVKDFSGEYAPFNSAMAKIQQMTEEGLR